MKKEKKFSTNNVAKISLSLVAAVGLLPDVAIAQSVNCPQPLVFGGFVPCGSANNVTVTPTGGRSIGGCLSSNGAPFNNARCVVTQGFPLQSIAISITSSSYNISNGSGDTMVINSFNLITNAGGRSTTVAPTFFVDVPIGATLGVGANQEAGTYTGNFTINTTLQ